MTMTPGHTTMKELRLRHAELEASAQRLRDRAVGMDPTRATTAGTMRLARTTQVRADEYAAIMRLLAAPTLDDMERDVTTALTSPGGDEVAMLALEPGLTRAQSLMRSLFNHWGSQR